MVISYYCSKGNFLRKRIQEFTLVYYHTLRNYLSKDLLITHSIYTNLKFSKSMFESHSFLHNFLSDRPYDLHQYLPQIVLQNNHANLKTSCYCYRKIEIGEYLLL